MQTLQMKQSKGKTAGKNDTAAGPSAAAGQLQSAELSATSKSPAPSPTDCSKIIRDNFATWSGGDGYLSRTDIAKLMQDPSIKGDAAAALAAIRVYLEELEELSNDEWGDENDGLTLADLTEYERNPSPKKGNLKHLSGNFWGGKSKIKNAPSKTFTDAAKKADYSKVKQGSIGDCYFLAALVSKIAIDPGYVDRIIKPTKDGKFEVSLPGKPKVTVEPPTDSEIATAAQADGMWIVILEKAYGQVRSDADEDRYEEIDGDTLKEGIGSITGKGTDTDDLWATSLSTTRTKLKNAFTAPKKVVTASIQSENKLNLPKGHAYSVLDFSESDDTITLRNPWGSGGPKPEAKHKDTYTYTDHGGGKWTMKLEDFDSIFSQIAYEEDK